MDSRRHISLPNTTNILDPLDRAKYFSIVCIHIFVFISLHLYVGHTKLIHLVLADFCTKFMSGMWALRFVSFIS
jgi:hypothetical protein